MGKKNILIVEDEHIVAQDIKTALEHIGYGVPAIVTTGEEALRIAANIQPALVLIDIHLAGSMDGVDAVKKIISEFDIPVIYLTAYADNETLQRAKYTSPYGYILKPFDENNLRLTVEIAIHKHMTEKIRQQGEEKFRRLIEHSSDGVMLTDEEGFIIEWNDAQARISGISQDDAIGKPLAYILQQIAMPGSSTKEYLTNFNKAKNLLLRDDKGEWIGHQSDVKFHRAPNDIRQGQVFTFPIPTQKGVQISAFTRDVTEQARAEEALRLSEEKLRALIAHASDGISLTDTNGKIETWNKQMAEVTGISQENAFNQPLWEIQAQLADPESYDQTELKSRLRLFYKNIFRKESVSQRILEENTIVRPDGNKRTIQISLTPIQTSKGIILSSIARDITQRKLAEEVAEQHKAELRVLMEVSHRVAETSRLDETLEKILENSVKHLNASAGSIVITSPIMSNSVLNQGLSEKTIPELQNHCPLNNRTKWHQCIMQKDITIQINRNNNDLAHYCAPLEEAGYQIILSTPLRDQNATLGYLHLYRLEHNSFTPAEIQFLETLIQQSIAAIKKANLFEEIQHLSITDSLTQLYNRRHFYTLGKHELERAQRYKTHLSALMIDADHFKRINDDYGHIKGDQILQALARHLRNSTREVDVLCRYGGEEFAILLPDTEKKAAGELAERLRRRVENKITLTPLNNHRTLTISIGVTSLGEDTPTLEALLDKADAALYEAKRAGRNTVVTR